MALHLMLDLHLNHFNSKITEHLMFIRLIIKRNFTYSLKLTASC
jgi:hypothetical protein